VQHEQAGHPVLDGVAVAVAEAADQRQEATKRLQVPPGSANRRQKLDTGIVLTDDDDLLLEWEGPVGRRLMSVKMPICAKFSLTGGSRVI
jgi:hypothetical protein